MRSFSSVAPSLLCATWVLAAPSLVVAQGPPTEAQIEPPTVDTPVPDTTASEETSTPVSPTAPDAVAPGTAAPGTAAPNSAASAPTPPPAGDSESTDLSEIEAALAEDTAEQAEALPVPASEGSPSVASSGSAASNLNPDFAFILDTALAYFSEDENLQAGGHDPTVTGFNLQQLELSASSSVDPYLRFDANLVFSQFGVEVEEAYGTTLDLPARLQARFGQFLHRFGRINPTHPHSWDFVDQPFALGRVFGGEGGRGLGVELSWLSPLPWYVELSTAAMQAGGEATARSFYGAYDLGVEGPLDLLYVTKVDQFFPITDDWSLLWGLSSALGPNPTGRGNRTDVYGSDVYLKYRPVTRESQFALAWQSEVFYRRRQVPEDLLQDVGVYTQVVLQLSKRWGVAGRYELGSPARNLDGNATAVGGVGVDLLDPEWTENRQRVSGNVTYWPTEFSRFRLQGSYDAPAWLDRGIWATFLAAELVVGAHGAHKF